jgi:hypothetical protein
MLDTAFGRAIQKILIVAFFTFVCGLGVGIAQVFYEGPATHYTTDSSGNREYYVDRRAAEEFRKNDTVEAISLRFNIGCVIGGVVGFIIGLSCKVPKGTSR